MAFADRREVPDAALAALVLEVTVNELRHRRREIIDGLDTAIKLDIGGIVVDEHVLPRDAIEHRDRCFAGLGDLAVDLDAKTDVAGGSIVGKFMDVAHEGFLVLPFAVVPANRCVHDVDPHPLAEVCCLEAEPQAVLGGKVGVAGERDRDKAEPVHHPLNAA